MTYRHDPAIEHLRDWIAAGRLGGPLLVRAHVYDEPRDGDPAHLARIMDTLAHGMPVVHEGAHVFDWLSTVLGSAPSTVDDSWAMRSDCDLPSPNLSGARLSYPDDHVALVEFGWLTDVLPRCEISFLGPRGHAVLDGRSFRLELVTAEGVEVADFPGDRTTRCFDLQLDRFVALATGDRDTPEPTLDDGLAALATCEQVARRALGGPR